MGGLVSVMEGKWALGGAEIVFDMVGGEVIGGVTKAAYKSLVKFVGFRGIENLFKEAFIEKVIYNIGKKENTIIIGESMDRVTMVAKKLGIDIKDATFEASEAASKQWNKFMRDYDGNVPENIAKGSEMYKENMQWIKKKIEEGYNILDIGTDKRPRSRSTFYKGEKEQVYKKQ